MSPAEKRDAEQRAAIESVGGAIASLNDALRAAMALNLRIEFGTVERGSSYDQKVARGWAQLWTKDGLAVRFTREEIVTAPAPEPPVVDDQPGVS